MPNREILMLLAGLRAFSTAVRPTTSRHAPPKASKHFQTIAGNSPAWRAHADGLTSWGCWKSSFKFQLHRVAESPNNGNRRLFESTGLWRKRHEIWGERGKMVGATGFEPATSSSQNWHSTKLSYAPTREKHTLTNEKIKISLPWRKRPIFS